MKVDQYDFLNISCQRFITYYLLLITYYLLLLSKIHTYYNLENTQKNLLTCLTGFRREFLKRAVLSKP